VLPEPKEDPMTTAAKFDQSAAEAFAQKMLTVLNYGGLAMMTSIGHRTGLFDTLSTLPPSTSREIAEAANLNERYVREWLGAMATGGIVDYDAAAGTYRLPAEHAAFLTRAASPNNIAVTAQFVAELGSVEGELVDCFRNGGGVPYSSFNRFHEIMAEESGQTVCAGLLEHVLPLVPGIAEKLESGIDVLDVGCGRGRALMLLAESFPKSRFAGYDISEEAIANAREEAKRRGLENVRYEVRDVSTLDEAAKYDLVTAFDIVHDQAKPAAVLAGIRKVLKPDGTFLMQDIAGSSHVEKNVDRPIAPFIYTISCMHCMTVSLAQDGEGLGAAWGKEKAIEMLDEAGFSSVDVKELEHDIINYWYVVRP
jgi:2-polyprenyl-3-methyl-5-hydroxy-6-metoxy-1,4-benzoquinol methylase